MSNYPNYYNQPMQAVQPIYPNYNFQPTQVPNPYIDRYAQQQQIAQIQQSQQQAQPQFQGLNGRIVDDFNAISANDVPMDAMGAIFIKSDGTEIQRRVWSSNGTIATTSYKPLQLNLDNKVDNLSAEGQNDAYGAFGEVLEGISAKIDGVQNRLDEFFGKAKTNSKAKKEAETE